MTAVPLVFNPTATANLVALLGGVTAGTGGDTVAVSTGGGTPADITINVFDLDLGSLSPSCTLADVQSVTVSTVYNESPSPLASNNNVGGAVFVGDSATLAAWGTVAATAGDTGVTGLPPQTVSRGWSAQGGSVPADGDAIIGTWSDPTPPSVLHVLVLSDANNQFGPLPAGQSITVALPTVDVTFAPGSPCATPPVAVPVPVDDTATGTVGTPAVVNVAANDDNTPCAPGCAVYRAGSPLVDPASTAAGASASVSPTGSVTAQATGPGTVIVNVESGCSPSCDPTGADVDPAGWVAQTVTATFAAAPVPLPVPVDDTGTGIVGTQSTGTAATNDNNTPCGTAPACAVYRLASVGGTAAGASGTVDAAGVWTADATGPGTVILTIESGCSPSCDPTGADVDPAGWVPQTVTVTFTPAGVPVPVPVDDTATGTTGTPAVVNVAANDNNTACAPGCAVYRLVTVGGTAAGAAAVVSPTGSVTAQATGPGTVIVNVESGCSPSCDPSGADVDPAGWVAQTVTVTFTDPVVPPAGPASHCFDPSTLLPL